MGCFNQTAFLSNLPIVSGDPTMLLFMVKNKYSTGYAHACYSGDNFQPIFLPIFGEYDDYGKIENIIEDANTKLIEEYFGKTIEEIVEDVDNNLIGRDKIKSPKNNELYRNLMFALEHKFIYDEMAKPQLSYMKEGNVSEYFLEDILGLVKNPIGSKHERYKYRYDIPGCDKYYIQSDKTWSHLAYSDTDEEIMDCTSLGGTWGFYHPYQFLLNVKVLCGVDFSDTISEYVKNADVFDIRYDITNLVKLTKIKSDERLIELKDIIKKMKSENIEVPEELEDEFFDYFGTDNRDSYKGEWVITTGGEGKTLVTDTLKKLNVLTNPELKEFLLNFLRFDYSVARFSWTYKLSSYGSQDTPYKGFVKIFGKMKEFLDNKIKERSELEDEDDE